MKKLLSIFFLVVCSVNLFSKTAQDENRVIQPKQPKKAYTLLFYEAGNNSLAQYLEEDIEELMSLISDKNVNLVAQVDIKNTSHIKRLYIKPGQIIECASLEKTAKNASGTRESFADFLAWGIPSFPADNYVVIIGNHGSGCLDRSKFISGHFLSRGIAFNDEYNVYLDNQDLKSTLEDAVLKHMNGKKFAIVGFDACLMNGAEILSQIQHTAEIVIASPEVEPGNGWGYTEILKIFKNNTPTPEELSKAIVKAYEKEYRERYAAFPGFTLVATRTNTVSKIEDNISNVAHCLEDLYKGPKGEAVRKLLMFIRRNRAMTPVFHDRNFVDLSRWYISISENFGAQPELARNPLVPKLQALVKDGLSLINNAIIARSFGSDHENIGGLSIYYPLNAAHASYAKTVFAKNCYWPKFLKNVPHGPTGLFA